MIDKIAFGGRIKTSELLHFDPAAEGDLLDPVSSFVVPDF